MTPDHGAPSQTKIECPSLRVRLKIRLQLVFSIITVMTLTPRIASAEAISPADQLAIRFTSFCLGHRLTKADLSQRATRLGAIQESVMSVGGYLRVFWRDPMFRDHARYSFDVSALPHQHIRIVGCSVGLKNVSVARVIAALEQPSRLGKSNDDNAPSLIARNAGWFFVKNREPNWVSVIAIPVGDDQSVVVGLSTHQRLRP